MQPEPTKQAYDTNVNQPPLGTGNLYPQNLPPPSYPGYAPQPGVYQPGGPGYPGQTPVYQPGGPGYPGQTPVYQPQGVRVVPVYRRWNNLVATPITSSLQTYFILSGILCIIWAILDIGLEIGIVVYSYSTYYRGIWAGGFLLGSGIALLIASCRTAYVMAYMIRMFSLTFFFIILGLILSIVNVATSIRCDRDYWYTYCDNQLAFDLKIAILAVFIVSGIHTIINMVVVSNAQKRTATSPA